MCDKLLEDQYYICMDVQSNEYNNISITFSGTKEIAYEVCQLVDKWNEDIFTSSEKIVETDTNGINFGELMVFKKTSHHTMYPDNFTGSNLLQF